MRILRVAPWLYPDTKGGGQYHVHAMSRDQAARGHDVTVLTIRQDQALPQFEERHGYTVLRYDSIASPLGNDIAPGMAIYLARVDGFDVIHAHSHYYVSTILAALKRRLGDIPLAITNHGLYSQSAPERVFRWYLRSVGRWTFNQADIVFCYTETDRDRVRNLGVSSRIEVVPNGIDTNRFTSDGPESELINTSGPVVLFVGRFAEGKRPWLAIEAFAEVLKEHPDAELYLCGDGPLRGNLVEKVRNRGISKSVKFLGHVRYDEMPKVYRSGDVLVLPSRTEGVPRTVLEALSAGVSVVSTDLPHIRSAVGESAFYFSIEDVHDLSTQIERAIRSGDIPNFEESFDWEQTIQQTTSILHEMSKIH